MNFQNKLLCLVLPRITSNLILYSFQYNSIDIPKQIVLADPDFNISSKIDMLIGSELFWQIILPDRQIINKNQLIYQETKLGWVVSGSIPISISLFVTTCHLETDNHTNDNLTRFWQIEEIVPNKPIMSNEELECEKHFTQTTSRDSTSRFIVKIPFNNLLNQLGDSRELTLRRFFHLENKLSRSHVLRNQYVEFMSQYLALGHMTEVHCDDSSFGYYIPHHCIIKDSISTKLRVVFDASMKTVSGISLNNTQLVGPVVQNDLLSIILRFRQYSYVLTGDIKMMYRQKLIDPVQRKYQRIFWRN